MICIFVYMLSLFNPRLTCVCPVLDCRPRAAGRDVPGRAEGAAGPAEGGPANGAAGETGTHPGGEAEQEAAAAGADGHHRPPQESPGTGRGHKVRIMFVGKCGQEEG